MLPKTLRIQGHDIKIVLKRRMKFRDKYAVGLASYNDGRIYVAQYTKDSYKISLPVQKSIVLHEVIHYIDYFLNLGLRERQVELLASGLYQFLSDNDLKINNKRRSK